MKLRAATRTAWPSWRRPWWLCAPLLAATLGVASEAVPAGASPIDPVVSATGLHSAVARPVTTHSHVVAIPRTGPYAATADTTAGYIYSELTDLHHPWGVAVNSAGSVVVSEQVGAVIVMLAGVSGNFFGQAMTAGQTYVIAGTGTAGYSGNGGPATSAKISYPAGVAFDSSGDLVFADQGNCVVREVSVSTGDISNVGGTPSQCGDTITSGPAISQEINTPTGVAVDSAGNILVVDSFNYVVRVIAGQACSPDCPYGLPSMTPGYMYTIAGDGGSGYAGDGVPGTSAEIRPEGVTVDADGNVLVADSANEVIRVLAGSSCSSGCPYGLSSMKSGYIYTIAGTTDGTSGESGYSGDGGAATSATFYDPYSTAVDTDGNILISDKGNNVVRLIAESAANPGYTLRSDCGSGGDAACTWAQGSVYTVAGDGTPGATGDGGPAVAAELDQPYAVTVADFGQVFVGDTGTGSLRYFSGSPITGPSPSETSVLLSVPSPTYGDEQVETISVSVAPEFTGIVPTGSVTVAESSETVCVVTLSSGAGSCELSASQLGGGSYGLVATYSGDSDFGGSSSSAAALVVSAATSSTAMDLSQAKATYGDEEVETISATVTPEFAGTVPGGSVVVTESSASLCAIQLSSGSGSCKLAPRKLAVGSYSLVATYGGDANFDGSVSSAAALAVSKATSTTVLKLGKAKAVYGNEGAETLYATVTPEFAGTVPTGVVTVKTAKAVLCKVTLAAAKGSAKGSCPLAPRQLAAGSYSLEASYPGNAALGGSSSSTALTVSKASTTSMLTLSEAKVTLGREKVEKISVTVASPFGGAVPTGTLTVTVKATKATVCTLTLVTGKGLCSLSASQLAAGDYRLVATYSGNSDFAASVGAPVSLTVTKPA